MLVHMNRTGQVRYWGTISAGCIYSRPARLTFAPPAIALSMLQISTRVRYGVRMLVRLAIEDRALSRREMAEAEAR